MTAPSVFLVGGAVRDELLNLPVVDRDWVVVGSTPSAMLNEGYLQVGKDFPVFLHPDTKEEYALARTERKSGTGYQGFEVHASPDVTLEQDLARRDLTINAIAKHQSGELFDPYDGARDLANKTLRHVTDAFSEDPLRVLRVARFAARFSNLGFVIAPETMALMRNISASGELKTLSCERVWQETERALGSARPRVYFETLRECGALAALFPEVDALFGIPQRPEYHPEIDTGLHCMLAIDQICQQTSDTKMRFATLVHDLGKATTPAHILPGHQGHEERSAQLTEVMCDRLRIPNAFRKLAVKVARDHLNCHRALQLKPSTVERLLSRLDAWRNEDYVVGFVNCCMADARGRTGLETRPYPQFDYLLDCAAAGKEVQAKEFVSAGLKGEQLGDAIRQERIKRIAGIKKAYSHIDEEKFTRTVAKK